MLLCAVALCGSFLTQWDGVTHVKKRQKVCVSVYKEAERQKVDPVLAVAVAWIESGFIASAKSSAGAVGPMQVMPQFWCPGGKRKGCKLIKEGVRALKYYVDRYGVNSGLCAYASGKPCIKAGRAASVYRSKVIDLALGIDLIHQQQCVEDRCGEALEMLHNGQCPEGC